MSHIAYPSHLGPKMFQKMFFKKFTLLPWINLANIKPQFQPNPNIRLKQNIESQQPGNVSTFWNTI